MELANGKKQARFLDGLTKLLGTERAGEIFPCIEDLVVNGRQASRFSSSEFPPNRQDVTQYLAAWCRFAGLNAELCRQWLTEYALSMLSAISKSSASGIRHSTKSNVKYIYRDEIPFSCGREGNPFRARCSNECPVYARMANPPSKRPYKPPAALNQLLTSLLPVKQRYREQYEAGLEFVRRELGAGTKMPKILERLNQQGLKTRTGRGWTLSILYREIRALKQTQAEEP